MNNTIFYQFLHVLGKLTEFYAKIPENVNKMNANLSDIRNNLNHDNSL